MLGNSETRIRTNNESVIQTDTDICIRRWMNLPMLCKGSIGWLSDTEI